MENLPGTANHNFLAPPCRADPFRFDELQKRLCLIEKSMDGPKPSMIIPESDSIPEPEQNLEHLCRTMCSRGLAEHLCREMCSTGLKKHRVSNGPRLHLRRLSKLSDVPKLQERIRAALKLAPNPADLVYECSKYVKDGQAFVLLMELFLRMIGDGEVEIPASTEQAAHARARRWRDMYHPHGGWEEDRRIHARAFLFFLASFGIPADFASDYVMNLVVLSHPSEVSETLRKSRVLVPIIPDMIEKMLQYKLYAEAIDVALTFGIEDKFPVDPIVASFLAERAIAEFIRYGALKEQGNSAMDLKIRLRTLNQALTDHNFNDISTSSRLGLRVLAVRVRRVLDADREERKRKRKSNDDVNRKRERDEMDMDTEKEKEHPPLARRLVIEGLSLRKRQRTEPFTFAT